MLRLICSIELNRVASVRGIDMAAVPTLSYLESEMCCKKKRRMNSTRRRARWCLHRTTDFTLLSVVQCEWKKKLSLECRESCVVFGVFWLWHYFRLIWIDVIFASTPFVNFDYLTLRLLHHFITHFFWILSSLPPSTPLLSSYFLLLILPTLVSTFDKQYTSFVTARRSSHSENFSLLEMLSAEYCEYFESWFQSRVRVSWSLAHPKNKPSHPLCYALCLMLTQNHQQKLKGIFIHSFSQSSLLFVLSRFLFAFFAVFLEYHPLFDVIFSISFACEWRGGRVG